VSQVLKPLILDLFPRHLSTYGMLGQNAREGQAKQTMTMIFTLLVAIISMHRPMHSGELEKRCSSRLRKKTSNHCAKIGQAVQHQAPSTGGYGDHLCTYPEQRIDGNEGQEAVPR